MSDNSQINNGSGDSVRSIDREGAGVKTQVVQLDFGGGSGNPEQLASIDNPYPVTDAKVANFLFRILQMLMAPLGFDKSLQRYRQTAIIESGTVTTVTTVTTLTTCSSVTNLASIGGDQGQLLTRGANLTAWALNVRARIT